MNKLRQSSRAKAFTLLEVIIVLAITALVLGAVYSLAQGTLMLADDVRRAERRDARIQAFTTFCEHLLAELPANALLTLTTTQEHGQYLTRLELEHVRSPFDETPDCRVALFTQGQPGGGLRLMVKCQDTSVVLFEDLAQCEWRAFESTSRQWTTVWNNASKPGLMEFSMQQAGIRESSVFWIPPNTPAQP